MTWPRLMRAVVVLMALPAVALAHAHLVTASPAENATVVAPAQVVLAFTQPLEKEFSSIEVWDAKGKRVDGDKLPADADGKHLALSR
jgi:methionine-rich copper-binding protein CopC